jgi:S-adenosylmethionine:tRNA ribosyltransferase-isomerase
MTAVDAGFDFRLSDELIAHEPPEARGLARDGVRLMVSRISDDSITHARFSALPEFLERGDFLVVNTSATINAALEGIHRGSDRIRTPVLLHLSAPISEWRWVVELRRFTEDGHVPFVDAQVGDRMLLAAGGVARLIEPYLPSPAAVRAARVRLWIAELLLPGGVRAYSERHGSPIRYGYVRDRWPLKYYQTVFSKEPGSAEMPSAGRAFTPEMLVRLTRRGVWIAPVVLHTGVSSLEIDEPPYPERYQVPLSTARAINDARAIGARIIAVGTTVVRALETVANDDGSVRAGHGWTDLAITEDRGVRAVDGLLTGLHSPDTSHLSLLAAFAGRDYLNRAYEEALAHRYLWHEFGDLHLILP